MGLDIYIQRCPDRAAARAAESAYEKATNGISDRLRKQMFGTLDWKGFDTFPQERCDEFWALYKKECEPLRAQFGMKDEWGSHSSDEKIEIDSKLHPEHYWKVGYFRSSYNESGFNSYADRLGIPTLHEIFDNEDREYEFVPDWTDARDRAADALNALRRKDFGFDVYSIDSNPFMGPPKITDDHSALECFRKQHADWGKRKDGEGFESYFNGEGHFMVKGLTIHAAIPGTKEFMGRQLPCTYLVVRQDKENWYAQALEILIEACNYVLEQPDREHYYLHWSC